MLELCGMQTTPLLPSIPGPLWPRVVANDRVLSIVVAPDRVLPMGKIKLIDVLLLN